MNKEDTKQDNHVNGMLSTIEYDKFEIEEQSIENDEIIDNYMESRM